MLCSAGGLLLEVYDYEGVGNNSDVSKGKLYLNDVPQSATELRVPEISSNDVNVGPFLSALQAGDYVGFYDNNTPERLVRYEVTGAATFVNNGGDDSFYRVPVNPIALGGSIPSAGSEVQFGFLFNAIGPTGAQGPVGPLARWAPRARPPT